MHNTTEQIDQSSFFEILDSDGTGGSRLAEVGYLSSRLLILRQDVDVFGMLGRPPVTEVWRRVGPMPALTASPEAALVRTPSAAVVKSSDVSRSALWRFGMPLLGQAVLSVR